MDTFNHLLVIRLSAMGDVSMTVPILKSLTQAYPQLKVTVLTKPFFTPIFFDIPNVQVFEAHVSDRHKGVRGLYKLYKALKPLQIEAVADLHNVLRSNILKQFFRMDSIPFVQIDKGRKEKKQLTSWRDKEITPLKTTHQRYADVFGKLGFSLDPSAKDILQRRQLPESAMEMLGNEPKKWIGLAPFAAFSGKEYPLDLMEEVVKSLNNTEKYKIILFGGGKKEGQLLGHWQDQYTHCTNMVGRLSFEQEIALISNLDLMVSMDSGNGHLAAMFGIPTITLWGVTHPYAGFYPFAQDPGNAILADRTAYPFIPTSVYGNKVPKGYDDVMRSIQPQDVVAKISELLD